MVVQGISTSKVLFDGATERQKNLFRSRINGLLQLATNWWCCRSNERKVTVFKKIDELKRLLVEEKLSPELANEVFDYLLGRVDCKNRKILGRRHNNNLAYLVRELLATKIISYSKERLESIFHSESRHFYIETFVTVYGPKSFDFKNNSQLRQEVGRACIRISKVFWEIYDASKAKVKEDYAMMISVHITPFLFGGSRFIAWDKEVFENRCLKGIIKKNREELAIEIKRYFSSAFPSREFSQERFRNYVKM